MVERLAAGWSVPAVAAALGVDPKTVREWRARHAAEGGAGLLDRPSRPRRPPDRLVGSSVDAIEASRRRRLSGPAIARRLGRPVSTVGPVPRRRGLGRPAALDPEPAVPRHGRERPGELIHLDTKKLGRVRGGVGHRITGDRTRRSSPRGRGGGAGREHPRVAIDDAPRPAYTEVLAGERTPDALAFLDRAPAWFKGHGVQAERVMTDSGPAYVSSAFRRALAQAGVRHERTKPHTPRTNGEAERFIRTSSREWAYAAPCQTSAERAEAVPGWLCVYNSRRPHSALGGRPPISRLPKDNLLGNDT